VILVRNRYDAQDALAHGLDINKLMWGRMEEYAVIFIGPDGFSVLYAQDDATAAVMVLKVLHDGEIVAGCPHDDMNVPQAVADMLAANASGMH
jgi:hypothetical protein